MPSDTHARALLLLDRAGLEGLSAQEQSWLDSHLACCSECSAYAEASERVIRALDGFAFDLDPAAAARVEETVRGRVEGLAPAPLRGRWVSGALAAALALTAIGSVAMWQPAAWLAARWNLPAAAWHTAFALFWLLPSVVFDLLLLFRGRFLADRGEGREII